MKITNMVSTSFMYKVVLLLALTFSFFFVGLVQQVGAQTWVEIGRGPCWFFCTPYSTCPGYPVPDYPSGGACSSVGSQCVWMDNSNIEVGFECRNPARVDCVGSWSSYGSCSASCGGGTQTRTYTVTTPASGGGAACPVANGATESIACNTQACTVSGEIRANGSLGPISVISGSSVSLQGTWSGSGWFCYIANSSGIPITPLASGGSVSTSVTLSASSAYQLVCGQSSGTGGGIGALVNSQVVDTVQVNVSAPPTEAPTGLVATPSPTCGSGQINVSWNPVSGAQHYRIEVDGVGLSNQIFGTSYTHTGLTPGSSHTYRVYTQYAGNSSGWSNLVRANAPAACAVPPTLTFTADSNSVPYNGGTTLRWTSTNATACNATGDWPSTGYVSLNSSTWTGNLTSNKTYYLECTGPGGSTGVRTVSVSVGAAPALSVSFIADRYTINRGESVRLTWQTANAASCSAGGGWSGGKSVGGPFNENSSPVSNTTYSLTCAGIYGGSHTAYVTVNVNTPPPDGSVSAADCWIPIGGNTCPSLVNWTSSNFFGSTNVWQGGSLFSGSTYGTANANIGFGNTTFTLRDTGNSSFLRTDTATASCTSGSAWNSSRGRCESTAVPSGSISATPNPCVVPMGGRDCTYNLQWTMSNVSNPSVTENSANFSGSQTYNNNLTKTPGNYTYTLRNSGTPIGGSSGVVTVNVVCASGSVYTNGSCVDNTPNQLPNVNAGPDRTITLPNTLANPIGATASDPDGVISSTVWAYVSGPRPPTITSGNTLSPSFTNLSVQGTYTFRLTATDNRGGQGSDTMTVTVAPQPTYSCSALPANASFYLNDDTGLSADTNSTYSANNTAPKCQFSCVAPYTWNGTSCAAPTPPAVPTGLTATPGTCGTGRIDLRWNSVSGVSSYDIQFNGGPAGTRVNTNTYAHNGLVAGQTYRYQVRSVGTPNSNYSSEVTATAPVACPPSLSDLQSGPINVSGTLTQGQNVTFSSRVVNNNSASTGGSFETNFTYRWGSSGGWNIINTTNQATLAGNESRNTNSSSFNLGGYGTLQIQHCVDSSPERITESNEGNNCTTQSYTVTQAPSAPTLIFVGNPLTINPGDSSTLRWVATGADSCTASAVPAANTASNSWTGSKGSNNGQVYTQSVSPVQTTTYTLSCTRGSFTTTQTVEVRVNTVSGPSMGSLIANPNNVAPGGNVNLNYNKGPDFQICSIYNLNDITYLFGLPFPRLGSTAIANLNFGARTGSVRVNPNVDSTYVLLCLWGNNVGNNTFAIGNGTPYIAGQDSVTVTSGPTAPTVSLSANPGLIDSGQSTNVSWVVSNANNCTASAVPTLPGWAGVKSSTGGSESITITNTGSSPANYTLRLTCTNGAGGSSFAEAPVTVNPAPVAPKPNLNGGVIIGNGDFTVGQTVTFNSSVANNGSAATPVGFRTDYTYRWSPTGAWVQFSDNNYGVLSAGASNPDASRGLTLNPPSSQSAPYTLYIQHCVDSDRVVDESDETDNCGYQTYANIPDAPVPPSINFTASPNTILQGGSSNLSWTVTDATACTASNGWSGSKNSSGGSESVSPNVTTTYTLTCSGPGGSSNQSVTVTVNLPTGDLTGVGCSVLAGQSTCNGSLGWTGVNAINPYISNQTSPSTPVYSGIAMPNGSRSGIVLNLGTITMLLRSGNYTIDQADLTAGCATGTFRLGNTCHNPPQITIDINPGLVRSGSTASVDVTIDAAYPVSCTATGVDGTGTINHPGSPSRANYVLTTKPLKAKQEVTVTCGSVPPTTGLDATGRATVDVLPSIEET